MPQEIEVRHLATARLVRNVVGELRCPQCGEWNPKDADYCVYCGAPVGSKESLNSSPVLFTAEWQKHVTENTSQFFNALLPTMGQLMNPELQGVAIKQKTLIIQGKQSSGKNTKASTIIHEVRRRYGAKNVAVHQTEERRGSAQAQFRTILDAPEWPRKMIQCCVLQDCTNVKFTEQDLQEFWQIRHVMREKTGLSRGLILLIFTEHSYFEFQKQFRLTPDMILMSDMPGNPRHREECERTFITDKLDQQRISKLTQMRENNPKLCGYTYMVENGAPVGFVHLPQVTEAKPRGKLHLKLPSLHLPRFTPPTPHRAPKFEAPIDGSDRGRPELAGWLLVALGVLTLVLLWVSKAFSH